ncbi:hypothetical protein LTR27_003152 [Elasticomyces elasticus]|nr:hypothetical protein LTR27_003152 [Elasticomyces elasticus]
MDHSNLNRLPPEIRIDIYNLVLMPRILGPGNPVFRGAVQHPITRVCRQLRRETLLLDYATIELFMTTHASFCEDMNGEFTADWLRSIGPEASSHLRCIESSFFSDALHGHFQTGSIRSARSIAIHEPRKFERAFVYNWHRRLGYESMSTLPETFWALTRHKTVLKVLTEMGIEMHAARFSPTTLPGHPKIDAITNDQEIKMEHSPLALLPSELRNRIYELVIPRSQLVFVGDPNNKDPIHHPITFVCSQIRRETFLMNCATLWVMRFCDMSTRPEINGKRLAKWLLALGPEASSHIGFMPSAISLAQLMVNRKRAAEAALASDYSYSSEATTSKLAAGAYVFHLRELPDRFREPGTHHHAVLEALTQMGVKMCAVRQVYASGVMSWFILMLPYTGVTDGGE